VKSCGKLVDVRVYTRDGHGLDPSTGWIELGNVGLNFFTSVMGWVALGSITL